MHDSSDVIYSVNCQCTLPGPAVLKGVFWEVLRLHSPTLIPVAAYAGLLQWFCSVRLGPENPGSSPTVNHCVCLVVLVASDWLPLPARGESIRGVWGTGSGPFPPAAAGQWFDGDQGCGAMMGSGLKCTVPHLLPWHCCRVGLDACGSEGSTTLVIGGGLVCVCHL